MRSKKITKIFAILLAVCFVLSVTIAAVSAASSTVTTTTSLPQNTYAGSPVATPTTISTAITPMDSNLMGPSDLSDSGGNLINSYSGGDFGCGNSCANSVCGSCLADFMYGNSWVNFSGALLIAAYDGFFTNAIQQILQSALWSPGFNFN